MDKSLSLCLALALVASSTVATAQDTPPERPAKPAPARKKAPVVVEDAEEAPAPEAAPEDTGAPEAGEDDPLEAMSVPATELEPEEEAEAEAQPEAAAKKTPARAKARAVVAVMPTIGPTVLPYEEGQAIPEGYERDSQMRTGLLIGGTITFLVPYLSTVMIALQAQGDAREGSMSSHHADELSPLYIPIAGPFIAIGTNDRDDAREIAPFVASGVVQAAGVAMAIAGLVSRKEVLVRKQTVVTPVVSSSTVGLGVSGSF